jgi:hypothetical protein
MVLWGFKTEATFDVWSIEHLMMGISLASFSFMIIKKWNKKEEIPASLQMKISFLLVLATALFWEALEHYVELGLLGSKIEYWFQGVEHWSNRLISDNLMVMSGWLIYTRKNKIVWFARIFSIIWLFFHIIIFPHSMYLHTLFNSGTK